MVVSSSESLTNTFRPFTYRYRNEVQVLNSDIRKKRKQGHLHWIALIVLLLMGTGCIEVQGNDQDSPGASPTETLILGVPSDEIGILEVTPSPTQQEQTPTAEMATATPSTPQVTAAPEGEAPQNGTVFESLGEILEQEGARVRIDDPVQQDYFRTASRILEVNGEKVLAFAFPSERAAHNAALEISEDGRTVAGRDVNFRTTPHYFMEDRFILLTVTEDERLLDLLGRAMGDPFAGGEPRLVRPEGFVIETAEDVYHAFIYEGVDVEVGTNLNAPVQTEEAFYIVVEGEQVQLYQMSTREDAERVADAISEDGSSIGVFPIPANGTPHFFLAGRVIVFYQGETPQLLELMVELLGEPITQNI
jgi:hypothetical protein